MRERKVGLLCERLGDLPKYTSLLRIIFFPRGIVVRGQIRDIQGDTMSHIHKHDFAETIPKVNSELHSEKGRELSVRLESYLVLESLLLLKSVACSSLAEHTDNKEHGDEKEQGAAPHDCHLKCWVCQVMSLCLVGTQQKAPPSSLIRVHWPELVAWAQEEGKEAAGSRGHVDISEHYVCHGYLCHGYTIPTQS
ncbi:hypothetical protein CB1_001073081 [Camelus ferus]|nr:hypothetical protein CB1_001073081 [Camelus ferus]